MRFRKMAWRALTPAFAVRLYYFARHRALLSARSEVDASRLTDWGPGCVVSSYVKIKISGPFRMGRGVQIGTGTFIGVGGGGLHLGDHVMVSPNCTILTGNYRWDRLDVPLQDQGTVNPGVRIGRNVWIGANSVVLAGSEIGDNAIVSAGSVVSGRVPSNAIVQGNPAKTIFIRR